MDDALYVLPATLTIRAPSPQHAFDAAVVALGAAIADVVNVGLGDAHALPGDAAPSTVRVVGLVAQLASGAEVTLQLAPTNGAEPDGDCAPVETGHAGPDCGESISLQPSGWWTHDGLPGDCWRQSMDGPGIGAGDPSTTGHDGPPPDLPDGYVWAHEQHGPSPAGPFPRR